MVDQAIDSGTPVMVETVLSSDKFRTRVLRAIEAGFRFGFVLVTVQAPELNEARVMNRVARVGHDVPSDRLRARRVRAHANAGWFAARCAVGLAFDNSASTPVLLAEKQQDEATWRLNDPGLLQQLGIALP